MKIIIKRILQVIGIILLLISIILILNTATIKCKQVHVEDTKLDINLDMNKASENLCKALQFKTISYTDPKDFDYSEFLNLHKFIDETYPSVTNNLKKEVINNYSLLYTWEGSNKELKPIVLCAHMDVVGIEEDTLQEWKYDPFSGEIAEGKIWGRGARDNKCQVFSILDY